MKVGLFVPCYVTTLRPEAGEACYRLLKALGVDVEYPARQTCCGQPMANAGRESKSKTLLRKFDELFGCYDYVVGPGASCISFLREGHKCECSDRVYDICEFIHDIIRPTSLPWASFPHKVSIHNSCHATRVMHMAASSELNVPYYNKLRSLLQLVDGIEIVEPERRDECCGFGGMFSVEESAVSIQMGRDKVARHIATGAEYITGADYSCLMHQKGIIEKMGGEPIKVIHIVEILSCGL